MWIRHDLSFLIKYVNENGITLLQDYTNSKITVKSNIECKCNSKNCSEIFSKPFSQIILYGAYCKKCINIRFFNFSLTSGRFKILSTP